MRGVAGRLTFVIGIFRVCGVDEAADLDVTGANKLRLALKSPPSLEPEPELGVSGVVAAEALDASSDLTPSRRTGITIDGDDEPFDAAAADSDLDAAVVELAVDDEDLDLALSDVVDVVD